MRLGVGFTPFETRTDVIARLASHAEDVGLDRVDVAEGWTHDSLIVLGGARHANVAHRAGDFDHLRVGTDAGHHGARGGRAAAHVRGSLLARDRGGKPTARRGFSRPRMGPAAGSPAGDVDRGPCAPGRRSPARTCTERASAAPGCCPGVAGADPARCSGPGLDPARGSSWRTGGHPSCGHAHASRKGGHFFRRASVPASCPRPLASHSESRWHSGLTRRARGGCGLVAVDLPDAHGSAVPAHVGAAIRDERRRRRDRRGRRWEGAIRTSGGCRGARPGRDAVRDLRQAGDTIAAWFDAGADSINLVLPRAIPAGAGRVPGRRIPRIRPGVALGWGSVPPLISREEALRLGEITDRAEIEALVERAWQVRQDRFGDSTDMCSLVNAKSGGCAEDCGFCSSRASRRRTRRCTR